MSNPTFSEQVSETTAAEFVADQYDALAESARQCVEDKPVTSSLVTLGAGFAIGIGIASLIGRSESNQRNSFADQISNRVVNGLSNWMPKSFHS